MPVRYGNKALIPVGSVDIQKVYQTTGDGTKIGSLFNITLQGKVIAYKGSPMSDGTFWTNTGYPADESLTADQYFNSLSRKVEGIRQLFATDGLSLELQDTLGSVPIKCNPRIKSVSFPASTQWFNVVDYTVELEADILYGAAFLGPSGESTFESMISEASESWNIEFNDEPQFTGQTTLDFKASQSYRLTHSISATGKRFYDENGNVVKPAWQQARDYVLPRLGLDQDRITASGVLNLPSYYGGFNHARTENVDEVGGGYSVTETWIVASGSALEDINVTVRKENSTDLTSVSIDGRITGLETRDSNFQVTRTRYEAAANKFAQVSGLIYSRAKEISGYNLNIQPTSYSIARSHTQGTINYSYEYNDRASNIVSGSLFEQISLTDNLAGDVFAEIPILGRAAGPILQDIGTKTAGRRGLSINLTVPKSSPTASVASLQSAFQTPRANPTYSGNIQTILTAATPAGYSQVFQSEPQESWDPWTGTYSMNTSWVYSS